MTRALALATFALCACGDNQAQPPLHGGSRLELVDYAFTDGAHVTDPHTFWDERVGEYCTATRFSDGNRYCMPVTAAGEVFFTDDHCTKPIGVRHYWEADPPHFFIGYYTLHGTTLPSRLYRPGVGVDAPSVLWKTVDGQCIATTSDVSAGSFYSLNMVVAPSDLVRFRELSRLDGDRIEIGVDTSDDGLVAFGASYDRLAGECVITGDANASQWICMQSPYYVSTLFSDASCSAVLATASADEGPPPDHVVDAPSGSFGCFTLFDIGDPVTDPVVYWQTGGTCRQTTVESGVQYFQTTASPIGFARMVRSPRSTESRVSAYELVDGPLMLPTADLFDQTLGTECWLSQVGTDTVCLPAAHETTTVFSDAGCATTLKLALVEDADCAEHFLFAHDDEGYFPIEHRNEQPMYELTTGDRCAIYQPPPGYSAYAIGPAISLDSLPRATVEVQR